MRHTGQKVRLVPRNDILLTTAAYDPTGLAIIAPAGPSRAGSGVESSPPTRRRSFLPGEASLGTGARGEAHAHAPRSRYMIEPPPAASSRTRSTGACRAAASPPLSMFLNCSIQPHGAGPVNHQFRRAPRGAA
jgi:hypothetical protein